MIENSNNNDFNFMKANNYDIKMSNDTNGEHSIKYDKKEYDNTTIDDNSVMIDTTGRDDKVDLLIRIHTAFKDSLLYQKDVEPLVMQRLKENI